MPVKIGKCEICKCDNVPLNFIVRSYGEHGEKIFAGWICLECEQKLWISDFLKETGNEQTT